MQIEVWAGLIGILATIASGVFYILKRESDSRAAKTQAIANTQVTDAQTRQKQAEASLEEARAKIEIAKAQEAQLGQMMKMLADQLRINEAWLQSVQQKEAQDERNYQVLKRVDDDNTKYLSAQIVETNRTLAAAIDQIPARIEMLNMDAVRVMAKEIGQAVAVEVAERVVLLVREMMQQDKSAAQREEPSPGVLAAAPGD